MFDWLKQLHDPAFISEMIGKGGLVALILIIFAETGLLVGFFLPGDSLLITAGVLTNPANPQHLPALNIWEVCILLSIAAVIGDQTGFVLGRKAGDKVWEWPDGRFYKKRYMEEARDFYLRYGPMAVVAARFIPIMRTFVPFAAGGCRMPYRKFVFWNIFGGILWIWSLMWVGYFLGGTKLAKSLDRIIVIVIVVSFLPMVFGFVKRMMRKDAPVAAGDAPAPTTGQESAPPG